MVGVLLLGFVLVIAVLVCSFLQASFPVALSVVSLFVGLMVGAGGGTMVQAIMAGGVVLVGGLVLATASDTYEEIRLAPPDRGQASRPVSPAAGKPTLFVSAATVRPCPETSARRSSSRGPHRDARC